MLTQYDRRMIQSQFTSETQLYCPAGFVVAQFIVHLLNNQKSNFTVRRGLCAPPLFLLIKKYAFFIKRRTTMQILETRPKEILLFPKTAHVV